jgi:MFS family permease
VTSVVEPEQLAGDDARYQWVVMANTTAAQFMSQLDGSIVIIALPAIFRGIGLDPLAPGNIAYLLWMIMGYRLIQAVTVVNFGRLGDMFGRVRIYNAGFVVFTASSILLSLCPLTGASGAQWLIGWRVIQALGGSMLTANSAAILTDAFPRERRGFALGINQVSGLSGMFIGLVAGGLLATVNWRLVFWVNVPVGVFGTLWAYLRLRDMPGSRQGGRIDWWGNATFALGLGAILVAVTYGIQPYGHHAMGWSNPVVVGLFVGGAILLAAFVVIETKVAQPLFQLSLLRIRPSPRAASPDLPCPSHAADCSSCSSSGYRAFGFRSTAMATPRLPCGLASSCCPSRQASSFRGRSPGHSQIASALGAWQPAA